MMNTKQKILSAALELYNAQGIKTSTRQIADSMGISAGNLHYHFKHTPDILTALFLEIKESFDQLISTFEMANPISQRTINEHIDSSFAIVWKYRFLFRNFMEVVNTAPTIREAYSKLILTREEQFRKIFSVMRENGYFRNDLPNHCWKTLSKQTMIAGDFWLVHQELVEELDREEAAKAFADFIHGIFVPYTTKFQGEEK